MKLTYIIYIGNTEQESKLYSLLDEIRLHTKSEYEIFVIDDFSKIKFNDLGPNATVVKTSPEKLYKYESYNVGLRYASGDFIKFIDVDDHFVSDIDINKLESVNDYDVIELCEATNYNVLFEDILDAKIDFSKCLFNSSIKTKMGYHFENYYEGIEELKFLLTCNLFDCVFCKYNMKNFTENASYVDYELLNKVKAIYSTKNSSENDMTFIMSFRDENHEVERTICSMRYMCHHANITLIDDFSDDGFDYEKIATRYGCKYERLSEQNGSAGGKNYGGQSNDTKYFCFFDAHQRIYHEDLDLTLVSLLETHPKSIIATRTTYIDKKEGNYINENDIKGKATGHKGLSYCCYITMENGFEWDPKWCDKILDKEDPYELSRVTCVLGAVYAMESSWYRYIHGFEGLTIYGLEETLMSIKTWMLGGTCYVLKNIGVGHLYRAHNPCPIDPCCIDANRIFLNNLFITEQETIDKYNKNLRTRISMQKFNKASGYLNDKWRWIDGHKKWLQANKVHPVEWVFSEINDKIKPNK